MIADSLENIEFYKGFSKDIYWGLKFISQADEGIKLGAYHINENVNAIVSEYATVACFESGAMRCPPRGVGAPPRAGGGSRVGWWVRGRRG